mgnify:CR=1 FL=1
MELDSHLHLPFWLGVGQIILIDILLGGDNAIVIALACRNLPPELRNKGILWGTAGAIVLRVILIFFAMALLSLPYLKLVGAALLIWIGIKLLVPEDDEHGDLKASDKLLGAIKTIIANRVGEITPRSRPMFRTISSISPRVFIRTPSDDEVRQSNPVARAAATVPPNFPSVATRMIRPQNIQSEG